MFSPEAEREATTPTLFDYLRQQGAMAGDEAAQ